MAGLKQFCNDQSITAGFFVGLGAATNLTLATYNLDTKKYEEKQFDGALEIANVTGNISLLKDEVSIHMHGSFSDETLSGIAGHVMKLVVGGTCEIKLDKFATSFQRDKDSNTGLNLLV